MWHEGRPELILEWTRYESVLNTVLAPFPVSLVCTYDTSRLDPVIVANARRTHPVVAGTVFQNGPARTSGSPPSCSAYGTRSRRLLQRGPRGSVTQPISRVLAGSCRQRPSGRVFRLSAPWT